MIYHAHTVRVASSVVKVSSLLLLAVVPDQYSLAMSCGETLMRRRDDVRWGKRAHTSDLVLTADRCAPRCLQLMLSSRNLDVDWASAFCLLCTPAAWELCRDCLPGPCVLHWLTWCFSTSWQGCLACGRSAAIFLISRRPSEARTWRTPVLHCSFSSVLCPPQYLTCTQKSAGCCVSYAAARHRVFSEMAQQPRREKSHTGASQVH